MNEAANADDSLAQAITSSKGRLQPRYIKDRLAKALVWTGGLGVIVALLLIFVYLLLEVRPLFGSPELEQRSVLSLRNAGAQTLYLAVEEQGELAMQVGADGVASFVELDGGQLRDRFALPIGDRRVLTVSEVSQESSLLAAALSDGSVLTFMHSYALTYPDNRRLITPSISYPDGEQPLQFLNEPARALSVREERGKLVLAAIQADGRLALKSIEKTTSLFGEATLTEGALQLWPLALNADRLLLDPLLGWLYAINSAEGDIALYQLDRNLVPTLADLVETGSRIEDAKFLAGGISMVTAQANGRIAQWFPARTDDGKWHLPRVRDFKAPGKAEVTAIGSEQRRRGFAVGDTSGQVALYYATAGRRVSSERLADGPIRHLVFNPRANTLLITDDHANTVVYRVHNEHPEVSWSALWDRVWYESYDQPRFLWQSSSASSDFEAKFSLTPLSLGTLKGAFYAMLFATPLAILGATFTANFMSPQMRQVVKPSVEVLAALPSVVLGFLAGLWLAPFVESNLPGMFLVLLLLPLSIPIFGYLWMQVPDSIRLRVPSGWEAALLMPVIALVVLLCFELAKPLELLFFGGNMQAWMDQRLGIGYEQRNALVVGIAMGIAVVPIIFSIAEDAIFSVPRHLSLGSLALGATPWQTLLGVVLPTASPAIFSAVMIGLGRAVGETMIVLMATGNTPVTDFSVFTGMRTLAANIAVEMPESEVGSTHFRLLFLAGLVLFLFTFFVNSLAELVRNRLRKKYSSL